MGGRGSDFIFSIDEALRLAGIAMQIGVEGFWFGRRDSAIQILVTARTEERLVRRDKPDEKAEGLVATIFFKPSQRAIDGEVVRIDVVEALLRADFSFAAFFEKRIRVVVGGVVVAEVVVPVAVFNAVGCVYFAEQRDFVTGLVEECQ